MRIFGNLAELAKKTSLTTPEFCTLIILHLRDVSRDPASVDLPETQTVSEELATFLQISKRDVVLLVERLEGFGFVAKDGRGYTVTPKGASAARLQDSLIQGPAGVWKWEALR